MIGYLRSHKNCTRRFQRLLDIIEDNMVVVNENHRAAADDLELQHTNSSSLPVPDETCHRRSSSTTILHDIGNLRRADAIS